MTRTADLSPEEIERRYGDQNYADAMAYVQGSEFSPKVSQGSGRGRQSAPR